MKNLLKIPRNFNAKFCWQWKSVPSGAPYADEYIKERKQSESLRKKESLKTHNSLNNLKTKVESTPGSTEYSNQKQIDSAIKMAKNGEKLPEGFDKIPASEFLKRSAEELRTLFIVDGIVNFRGNKNAYLVLGLANFFPKVSNKQQFVVLDSVPYAYGARRKDGKIGYGNPKYKAIKGGEKIEFFIGPPKTDENEKSRENFISFVKDQQNNEVSPPEEYSHIKLLEKFAENSKQLENLTLDEANKERTEFLKKQKQRDNREKIARQKEAELGLTETMNFKEKMEVIAKSVGESYNLPWEVIYAQAALESENGKHAPYNNYFGIKASKDWDGPSTGNLATKEDYGNGLENESAKFRGYSSMFDSAIGYAKFIHKYKRYKSARENFKTGGTPFLYLLEIKQAGYATDPNYVFKVNNIFKSHFGYDIPNIPKNKSNSRENLEIT